MQTGELLGAGLVAYMFYRLTTMEVKNQGNLMEEPASKDEPQAVTKIVFCSTINCVKGLNLREIRKEDASLSLFILVR